MMPPPETSGFSSLRLSPGNSQGYSAFPHGGLKRAMRGWGQAWSLQGQPQEEVPDRMTRKLAA